MNSRLLVHRQKKHGFQACCSENEEHTVDDAWQIVDASDQGNADIGSVKCELMWWSLVEIDAIIIIYCVVESNASNR